MVEERRDFNTTEEYIDYLKGGAIECINFSVCDMKVDTKILKEAFDTIFNQQIIFNGNSTVKIHDSEGSVVLQLHIEPHLSDTINNTPILNKEMMVGFIKLKALLRGITKKNNQEDASITLANYTAAKHFYSGLCDNEDHMSNDKGVYSLYIDKFGGNKIAIFFQNIFIGVIFSLFIISFSYLTSRLFLDIVNKITNKFRKNKYNTIKIGKN